MDLDQGAERQEAGELPDGGVLQRSTVGAPVQRLRVPLVVERRDDVALVLPVVTVERAAHAR